MVDVRCSFFVGTLLVGMLSLPIRCGLVFLFLSKISGRTKSMVVRNKNRLQPYWVTLLLNVRFSDYAVCASTNKKHPDESRSSTNDHDETSKAKSASLSTRQTSNLRKSLSIFFWTAHNCPSFYSFIPQYTSKMYVYSVGSELGEKRMH